MRNAAAAEPGPDAPEASPSPPRGGTMYNVRDYQNPDAGAAGRPHAAARKGKKKAKAKKK